MKKNIFYLLLCYTLALRTYPPEFYVQLFLNDGMFDTAEIFASMNPSITYNDELNLLIESFKKYEDDVTLFKSAVEARKKAGAGAGDAAAVAKEKQALEGIKTDIETLVRDSKISLKPINSPEEAKKELVSFFEKDKGIGDKLLKEIGADEGQRQAVKKSIENITPKKSK